MSIYPHCYRTEHSETITTNSIYGEWFHKMVDTKVPCQPELIKLLQYIDSSNLLFSKDLQEFISYPSISGSLEHIRDMKQARVYVENWMIRLGMKYEVYPIGEHVIDGKTVDLPEVILATMSGKNEEGKTLCVYAHIDIPNTDPKDWISDDPYTVQEIDKKFYGSGVSLGKGPLLAWLHALESFKEKEVDLPMTVKFIIEGMNQCGSVGLEDFLIQRRSDFLNDIDCLVVTESQWLGLKIPCVVYGSVGICHFEMTVTSPNNTPVEDMEQIFRKISDDFGNILIPHFENFVDQITPDEEIAYGNIKDFNVEDIVENLPDYQKHWDQVQVLMNFWRLPSIWVGDIQVCTCEKDDKSIAKREFALKLVPRQIADQAVSTTLEYIEELCQELKLASTVRCDCTSSSKPWFEDLNAPHFYAAKLASTQVYKDVPNMIREDRDIQCVKLLKRVMERPLVVLPMGNRDINAGMANENISLRCFYEGTKVLAAFIIQLAESKLKKVNESS